MSSGDWKTISTRCKTGFFQEIASNTQVSCNNSQALQPPAIGIPNFCIMLYTGAVAKTTFGALESTGVKNAFCNNTNSICDLPCTVPCQASGGNPSAWQDWYVLDDLLVYATTILNQQNNEYPLTVDTTGAVAMGITLNSSDYNYGVINPMQGPYGSIDISFGIVPLHTHDIENKGITQVPGPDTVAAALYTKMPDLQTEESSVNIEHYHALPAIYLSTVISDNFSENDASRLYASCDKKKFSDDDTTTTPQLFAKTTGPKDSSSGDNSKQRLWNYDSNEYGTLAYAMGNLSEMSESSETMMGGGYQAGKGVLPTPFPIGVVNALADTKQPNLDYSNGMTWKNWQKIPDVNDLSANDQSITIPSLTVPAEDIPIEGKNDVSCNDWFGVDEGVANPDLNAWRDNGKIVVDICLNSVVTTVGDYTNVATYTQSEEGLLSSGEVKNVESLEDVKLNDDDIPNDDGNLGYRSFGAFYIIYYPQIGNL